MAKRKRRTSIAVVVGFVLWLWDRIADAQQASQLWADKGRLMESIGWLLDQWWLGPLIVGAAVVSYVGMGFFDFLIRGDKPKDDDDTPSPSSATPSQQLTQQGIVNAPVININVPSPSEPHSSSSALQARIVDTKQELADLKAAKEPPTIDVRALGGMAVTVVVVNTGRPFKIGLITKLVTGSMFIDHPERPNSYYPRSLASGDDETTYQIVTIDSSGRVLVWGEVNTLVQTFESAYWRPISFEMELKFLSRDTKDHSPAIGRWMLKVSVDTKEKKLTATLSRMDY